MNNLKRTMALVLTMAMICSMGLTAFAAEEDPGETHPEEDMALSEVEVLPAEWADSDSEEATPAAEPESLPIEEEAAEVFVEETPAEEVLIEEVPAEEVPTAEVPMEEISAEEVSVQETTVEETPAEEVSVEETPAVNVHEEVPVEVIPVEQDLPEAIPVGTPEDVVPVEAPAEKAPAEAISVEQLPAQTPISETPGNAVPVEMPAEMVPVEEPPAEELPSEEAEEITVEISASEEIISDEAALAAKEVSRPWVEPGNTDAEILGGGRTLWDGGTLYFIDGGLWMDDYGSTYLLSYSAEGNLNLSDGWLYYTLDSGDVWRMPAGGGTEEPVYSFGAHIKQMYVMGTELRFLSNGAVYSYDMEIDTLTQVESPDYVLGLIPTEYGNLYLTGAIQNYDLWAGMNYICGGFQQCYTDSGYLVVVWDGETWQAPLSDMFSNGTADFTGYSLHSEYTGSGLGEAQQLENEAAFLESSTYQWMQDGLSMYADGVSVDSNPNIAFTGTMNTDQANIVKRARQMAEVTWTPLMWRYSWGGDNSFYNSYERGAHVVSVTGVETTGYFQGGETYKGIPYSQAVNTGYVGWNLSIDEFIQAVNDSSSEFYSGYSHYSRTAPYYGSDCSGFVSFAWDLPERCTCTSILAYCYRIENNIQNLQIGDAFNEPNSHIALVTNVGYDEDGYVNAVEITEQTPCKMRVTCYGELFPGKEYDNTGSLSYLQQYYFGNGYSIYRRNYSEGVSFQESNAVTLEESGYASAPNIALSVNSEGTAKVVNLTHSNSNAVIYYTTDGSAPTTSSTKYTSAFELKESAVVKAIADCGEPYTGSYTLSYEVTVEKARKPYIALVDGALQDGYVTAGTKITVTNEDNDTIYYTTDGSTPTRKSSVMSEEGIEITESMTFKAIAVSSSYLNSDVAELKVKLGTFYKVTVTEAKGGVISPDGIDRVLEGSDVTLTFTADTYYRISDVLIDGKSVGAVTSYTFKKVDKNHTVAAVFAVDLPFDDVTSQWFAGSVNFVYSKGLFSGTSVNKFSPNAKMTRGMFITVLGRFISDGQWRDLESWSGCLGITNGASISIRQKTATGDEIMVVGETGASGQRVTTLSRVPEGLDGAVWYKINCDGVEGYVREKMPGDSDRTLLYVYGGAFDDLPNGVYFTGYAQWAYIYGIMNGESETKFKPNNYITRQDICVLFYRYITNYTGKTLPTDASEFTDSDKVADYALEAVYAMKNIGVITGYEDGSLHPRGYATRAEVATMFERLYEWLYT